MLKARIYMHVRIDINTCMYMYTDVAYDTRDATLTVCMIVCSSVVL